jgi:4-hydroxy-tetrahydrodipicolinate reductase
MGKTIASRIHQTEGMELCGGTERPGHPAVGKTLGEVTGLAVPSVKVVDDLKEIVRSCDVVIDFSAPGASVLNFDVAAEAGKAIVIGTTGFTGEQISAMDSNRNRARCVRAPNMSIGVNVLFKLTADAAKILKDYDMEIMEIHHRMKKDAPSGTAIRLGQILAEAKGEILEEVGVFGRKGQIGERKEFEIGVQTLRGGDVVGEHTVFFAGTGERLELTHRAGSRDNFAQGAVRAAQWILNQPNGIYDMQDVLGLR